MPNWKQILDEIQAAGSIYDIVRRKYLERLHRVTVYGKSRSFNATVEGER